MLTTAGAMLGSGKPRERERETYNIGAITCNVYQAVESRVVIFGITVRSFGVWARAMEDWSAAATFRQDMKDVDRTSNARLLRTTWSHKKTPIELHLSS